MSRMLAGVACAMVLALAAQAQQQVRVEPSGSLRDLVGSPTLVTVVLQDGAEAPNLRIAELMSEHFMAVGPDGEQYFYTYGSVQAVRVQGGRIDRPRFEFDGARRLRGDEVQVVERAGMRAREIFNTASENQALRIQAAMLLTLGGDREAREYLERLLRTDDLPTNIAAGKALFLALGDEFAREGEFASLVNAGIGSGNRRVRAEAALLAGMGNVDAVLLELNRMLGDRSVEYSGPAARALARMQRRDAVPQLISMLMERNPDKGAAAIFALTRIGGNGVAEELKRQLPAASGEVRFRIQRVLFALGDPEGRRGLNDTIANVPTLAYEAALVLAADGDWDAMQFVRRQISRPTGLDDDSQIARLRGVIALIEGGEFEAPMAMLQEIVRTDSEAVSRAVTRRLTRVGRPILLTLLQSQVENANMQLALNACTAAIAIGHPEFRTRLVDAWDMHP